LHSFVYILLKTNVWTYFFCMHFPCRLLSFIFYYSWIVMPKFLLPVTSVFSMIKQSPSLLLFIVYNWQRPHVSGECCLKTSYYKQGYCINRIITQYEYILWTRISIHMCTASSKCCLVSLCFHFSPVARTEIWRTENSASGKEILPTVQTPINQLPNGLLLDARPCSLTVPYYH